MELFNSSTPDKAFKTSVRPLACLFIIQAVGFLFIFTSWPVEHLTRAPLPFIPDPFKKVFLIAMASLILIIGIGLFFRLKPFWYLFLAYITLGPIWLISGMFFGYFPAAEPKEIIVPIVAIFAVVITAGLYYVTKPAFR